ncbi:hypothetical protein C1645_744390 [Glomus cerebriforme]|uniref:Uncharacterized protein n=1 Tax=Glomus cerebriforme TaxID=658196 RepID=A0A397SBF3_9GLOM|nr:hypothetical protein C1645_744390 [Glomus cerebriforme]
MLNMNKTLLIAVLILVLLYLYYQQPRKYSLDSDSSDSEGGEESNLFENPKYEIKENASRSNSPVSDEDKKRYGRIRPLSILRKKYPSAFEFEKGKEQRAKHFDFDKRGTEKSSTKSEKNEKRPQLGYSDLFGKKMEAAGKDFKQFVKIKTLMEYIDWRLMNGANEDYENTLYDFCEGRQACSSMRAGDYTFEQAQEAVNKALTGDKELLKRLQDLPYLNPKYKLGV